MRAIASRHRRAGGDQRQLVAAVHDVADEMEAGAEPAAGMEDVEILGGEAARFRGARSPARRRARAASASRWSARGRAGRPRRRAAGRGRCRRRGRACSPASAVMAISGMPKRPGVFDQAAELGRLARPGERQDHVVRGDHAEIAVAGLGGVDEEGGRAGRGEGGGDLAADMAALADAADDHAAARRAGRGVLPVASWRSSTAPANGSAERRCWRVRRARRARSRSCGAPTPLRWPRSTLLSCRVPSETAD